MASPVLSAEAGLGQSVGTLAFQTATQSVVVAGQKLKFARCDALTEPDQTVWQVGSSPHGINLVATCPKAQLFALSERTLEPRIYVFSYPDMLQRMALELSTELNPDETPPLEWTALAFSRSGEQLAALSGLPEPTLVVWSLKTQSVLASGPLLVPSAGLAFDPMSEGSLCSMSAKRLLVWSLKLVYKTYMLDSVEVSSTDLTHPLLLARLHALTPPPNRLSNSRLSFP